MKKNIIALSISFLLLGCATVEDSYQYIVLHQTFDNSFEHTINNQNTSEDNKELLKNIQSDDVIMSLLKESTNKDDLNYPYFEKYKALVDLVRNGEKELEAKSSTKDLKQITSNHIEKNNDIKKEKTIKSKPTATVTKKYTKEETLKKFEHTGISADTKVEIKNDIVKNNSTQKEPYIIKQNKTEANKIDTTTKPKVSKAVQNINSENLRKQYIKIKDSLKNEHYMILAHCNIEDAYLLENDFKRYSDKIISLNGSKELAAYAIKENDISFKHCFEILEHFKNIQK